MKIDRPRLIQPIPDNAQRVFKGVIFDVYQWQQEQFDGTFKTFEKLKRADNSMVIPVTTEGKILASAQDHPGRATFYSFFGGNFDHENESPVDCAARELLEESGYQAESLELLDARQEFAKVECVQYIFIGKNCQKVAESHPESGERIKIIEMSFEEMIESLCFGDLRREVTLSIMALQAKLDPKRMEAFRKLFTK